MQYSELIIRILEIHIDSHYNLPFYKVQSKLELTKQAPVPTLNLHSIQRFKYPKSAIKSNHLVLHFKGSI